MSTASEFNAAETAAAGAADIYERCEPSATDKERVRALLAQAIEHYDVAKRKKQDDGNMGHAMRFAIRAAALRLELAKNGDDLSYGIKLLDQVEKECTRALKELDATQDATACLDGYLTLARCLYQRAGTVPPPQRELLLSSALEFLDAAEHLARREEDPHSAMCVRGERAHMLLARYSRERDLDLMEAIRNAEFALPYFTQHLERWPLQAPFLLNTLGNCCTQATYQRKWMLEMARNAYARGLELVDRAAFPKLAQVLSNNQLMSAATIASGDTQLPVKEMVRRLQSAIQTAVNAGDFDGALEAMWNYLRWSWTLEVAPNMFTAAAHAHISEFLERRGERDAAIEHGYAALTLASGVSDGGAELKQLRTEQEHRLVELLKTTAHEARIQAIIAQSETALREATDALRQGQQTIDTDADAAAPCFENALKLFPMHPLTLFYSGVVHMQRNQPIAALEAFNASLNIKPVSARALINRGVCAAEIGNDRQALADFDAALEIEPDNKFGLLDRANCRSRLNDMIRALADLDRVLEIDPNWSRARIIRANCRREVGDFDGALVDVDEALASGSDNDERDELMKLRGDIERQAGTDIGD